MCGIGGIIREGGRYPPCREQLEKMLSALRHRGPDGEGIHVLREGGLVQTRLALLDLSPHLLPLSSSDGRYRIVYNGEVYNHRALRNELSAHWEFRAQTDTETVLAAFSRWGKRVVDHLDGMFAFFIWDERLKRGFGARDPLGIKPFFHARIEGGVAFASEAQALVRSGAVPFAVDEEALAESLVAPFFSSVTRTPFSGISPLPPGSWLEIGPEGLRIERYFEFRSRPPFLSTDETLRQLAERMPQAVRETMEAEAPVGIFLSGGLDSTWMTALAQKDRRTPVQAWTIEYADHDEINYRNALIVKSPDPPYARLAASHLGCALKTVRVSEAVYREALIDTLRGSDLICAWEQEISQRLLARAAHPEIKAVLVGDAADETHFGYPFLMNSEIIFTPARIIEFFGVPPLRREFVRSPVEYFDEKYRGFAESLGCSWPEGEGARNESTRRLATTSLVVHLWLTRLLQNGDTHTMAHSLEARVPFGNKLMLELAQKLSPEVAFRDGIEKWHLRRAAEADLPKELAWRPKSALPKNLRAGAILRSLCREAMSNEGDLMSSYVELDEMRRRIDATPESDDRVNGLCFRYLAVSHWLRRFAG